MTTRRPTFRAFRALRTHRASMVAVVASAITVFALIQVPVCGMEMEACLLMSQGASVPSDGATTGAACPLAGGGGEMSGMECCDDGSHGQPVQPEGTDTQAQKQQIQPPALQGAGCTGECIPCGPDGTPRVDDSEDGAIPEVPLYTLFSSYLS